MTIDMTDLDQAAVRDRSERSKALLQLARTVGAKFDRDRLNAYLEQLKDVPTPRLVKGCQELGGTWPKEGKMPLPVLIRQGGITADRASREAPPRMSGKLEPMSAEDWLDYYGLVPRIEWLEQSPGRAEIERASERAAECGARPECQSGKCNEQIPVPRTYFPSGPENPPALVIAYGWCPEHQSRCEWRKGNRPAEAKRA